MEFADAFQFLLHALKALDDAASAAISVSKDKSPSNLMLRTLQEKMPWPKFMTLFS
jgi:hypothetical protein